MSKLVIVTDDPCKARKYAGDRGIVDYRCANTQQWDNYVWRKDAFGLSDFSLPPFVIIPETISVWGVMSIIYEEWHYDLYQWLELCLQVTGVRYDYYFLQQYFNDICTVSFLRGHLCYETRDKMWSHVPKLLEPLFILKEKEWILKSIE